MQLKDKRRSDLPSTHTLPIAPLPSLGAAFLNSPLSAGFNPVSQGSQQLGEAKPDSPRHEACPQKCSPGVKVTEEGGNRAWLLNSPSGPRCGRGECTDSLVDRGRKKASRRICLSTLKPSFCRWWPCAEQISKLKINLSVPWMVAVNIPVGKTLTVLSLGD